MRKSKDASQETKSLIKQLHENASVLGSKVSLEEPESKFDSMKSAILSYFFLNDILLGQTIGDDAIAEERIELANTLDDFQQEAKNHLFAQFISLLKKKGANISINESRTLLRKQFNGIIGPVLNLCRFVASPKFHHVGESPPKRF